MEDKQKILDLLLPALQATRNLSDLVELEYREDRELVYAKFAPMLGVCLGHQAMAEAFGATVSHAGQLMHGKTSQLKDVKTDSVLFQNLTLPIQVARYHSLAVKEETLPEELIVTARSEDNEIMAMEHKEYPIFGLQFHPESVMTPQDFR